MEPANLRFGGGSAVTVLDPLVAIIMLIATVLIFVLSHKRVIAPFLLAFFSIPVQQVLVVGGIHFTMAQILIIAVLFRMIAFPGTPQGKRLVGGFNSFDTVMVVWSFTIFVCIVLQWMDRQALIKNLADLLGNVGGYLVVRYLIPDRAAALRATKTLAVICVIQGACMSSEHFTYHNVFAFAGAPQPTYRSGHVRAEGVMGGLWGGAFASIAIPMFCWLWSEKKSRVFAISGIVGATIMALSTYASTAWMGYGSAILALCFWPIRKQMRWVRWTIACTIIGLHLVMHGPVWSIIEKIDITGGSSSYHRYMLVDNCIRHFNNWWLIGYKSYDSWGFDMWDLCNQFVAVALNGGLIGLILYITIFVKSFSAVGIARKQVSGDRKKEWMLWCLGSALFVNVIVSFGVSYMTHLSMCFFTLLACISAICFEFRKSPVRELSVLMRPTYGAFSVVKG